MTQTSNALKDSVDENVKAMIAIASHDDLMLALSDIRSALSANPSCSQDYLFQCCANAFEIAELAQKKVDNTNKKCYNTRILNN